MRPRTVLLALVLAFAAPARGDEACVPVGTWRAPGGAPLAAADVLRRATQASVVLLGETHDSAEHHRWQLQVLAALHAQRPNMVIGFESFPRRVQGALDRWVAGELSEADFLAQSDWRNVWRMDPQLYLPLFHFARMNRIPMLALNVDSGLTRAITQKGYDGVPPDRREGVGRPAPPTDAYVDWLLSIWARHEHAGAQGAPADRDNPDFRRFVESQQTWDRAMAEALAAATRRPGAPLVVGVMGVGHIRQGFGVPHQLRALGLTHVVSLLPWDRGAACAELVAGLADAVFGVAAPAAPGATDRPRLGVYLETVPEGVRIREVEPGSVADAAGLRAGDVVVEMAARPAREAGDLAAVVARQAPGTWLPLKVKRGAETLELVAKFPAPAQ